MCTCTNYIHTSICYKYSYVVNIHGHVLYAMLGVEGFAECYMGVIIMCYQCMGRHILKSLDQGGSKNCGNVVFSQYHSYYLCARASCERITSYFQSKIELVRQYLQKKQKAKAVKSSTVGKLA